MDSPKIKNFFSQVPTGALALGLGIAGIGTAWTLTKLPVTEEIKELGAVIDTIIILLFVGKIIFTYAHFIDDLKHNLRGSVITGMTMGMMVVSTEIVKINQVLGSSIWLIATILHLIIMAAFSYHQFQQRDFSNLLPSWFVTYVGIVVGALTCGPMGYPTYAKFLFYLGLFNYLVLLPPMIYRLIKIHYPHPGHLVFPVMAAPANLLLAGYLSAFKTYNNILLWILIVLALTTTLIVYVSLFKLVKYPFAPTYAAFTFPLGIGATAFLKYASINPSFYIVAWTELVIATFFVFFAIYGYLKHYLYDIHHKK